MDREHATGVVLRENARRRRKRSDEERDGEKSPQTTAWHRCKDSISGGSAPLSANRGVVTLEPSCVALLLDPRSQRRRSRLAPEALAATGDARDHGRARAERAAHVRGSGGDAVHARRCAVARARHRSVPYAARQAVGGAPGVAAAPEAEDGPDPRSSEHALGTVAARESVVGRATSDRIQARVTGTCAQAQGTPRLEPGDAHPPARAGRHRRARRSFRGRRGAPTRGSARGPPSYAADVRFAIVHHTAGENGYSRSEAAAIVKGIQLFHVQGNGWNDIGYNFLVDRFGTIYEGRFGGADRNVVGAHAMGFNTGSVGIALLGTYEDAAPSAAAQDAIARLVAWRLDLAHVDPTAFLTFISGGSDRYASGIPVLLNGVSGHRDTGFTACPGDVLYGRLGTIAASARVARRPQDLRTEGDRRWVRRSASALDSRSVRAGRSPSRARVEPRSRADPAAGRRSTGRGTRPELRAGSYRWTVSAGAARPALGTFRAGGGTAPLAIEAARRRARGDQPERRRPGGHDDV